MEKQGILIVLEGIDGSGKSYHIEFIYQYLLQKGYKVIKTKEPTKGRIGEFIHRYVRMQDRRLSPEAETFLFAADRFDHVKQIIEPALKKGLIVISDRYFHSSLAYQGTAGANIDWIREINSFAPNPDLAILLYIQPEFSLHRIRRKRTIFEMPDFLRKVNEFYLKFVKEGELVKVDADRPKKIVTEEILSIIQNLIKKHSI
jgi:dTMP kinase